MAAKSYEDFLAMGRNNLEDFLTVRGINKTGKKIELVAKAFAAVEMGIPILMSSEEQQLRLKKEYESRLKKHGLPDPRLVPKANRIDDVTCWPNLTLSNIFEYICA